jgi:hypothetical protein
MHRNLLVNIMQPTDALKVPSIIVIKLNPMD